MTPNKHPRSQIIDDLRRQLEDLESSSRAWHGVERNEFRSTGLAPLNALLPSGGWRQGTIVEWLAADEGAGACALAFRAVGPWLSEGETCVVVDVERDFYPAALTAAGIDFEQTLLVQPAPADTLWAVEQALACRGVSVTVAWLGPVPDRALRRLQLAAEAGGGLGVFFRPVEVRAEATWARLRLLASALPAVHEQAGRRVRLEVLYCRGGKSGGSVEVEVDDETGDVRMVPPLAPARDARQAT